MPVRNAAQTFATRISRATDPASPGQPHVRAPDGTVINGEEAEDALLALAGQPEAVTAPAVRDVLERVTRGELSLTAAARDGFIDAYKSAQPPPSNAVSPLAARIGNLTGAAVGGPSLTPSVVIPVKKGAGGSSTVAARVFLDTRVSFVKSNRGSDHMKTLRANFESDILAGQIFELVGVRAPQARVVDIGSNAQLAETMGRHVLDMDFVDEKLAGGKLVPPPFDPFGLDPIDDDVHPTQYHRMLAVDLLIGNSDRRGANFFNVDNNGTREPIPIDNNCGMLSGLTNRTLTNHTNFLKTFGDPSKGVGFNSVDPDTLGGVRNIIHEAPHYAQLLREPAHQGVLLAEIDALAASLTDEKIDQMVDALPREILPDDAEVVPWRTSYQSMLDAGTLPDAWQKVMAVAWGAADTTLSGDELFAARKAELKDTMKWRRDNLRAAVEAVIAHGVDDL